MTTDSLYYTRSCAGA